MQRRVTALGRALQRLGIRQPALSQQVGELRNAAVVATRREHKAVFDSLPDPRMRALLGAIEDILIRGRPQRRAPSRTSAAGAGAAVQAAQLSQVGDEA